MKVIRNRYGVESGFRAEQERCLDGESPPNYPLISTSSFRVSGSRSIIGSLRGVGGGGVGGLNAHNKA